MNRIRKLNSFEDSRFWEHLNKSAEEPALAEEREAIRGLQQNVPTVVRAALDLSSEVTRHMRQYTDHRDRHLLNVLAIMDALVPDDTMGQLHPLECALCVLAAFTHDLGMVMGAEELDALRDADTPEAKDWREYRAGFADEVRRIERLAETAGGTSAEAGAARRRIAEIEEYVLASYLRKHHTEDPDPAVNRIEAWLEEIETAADRPLYLYTAPDHDPIDFRWWLARIGLSHGHPVDWLRTQFSDSNSGGFLWPIGAERYLNLAYPGLLLRLADIMDFDASRAPRILFRHLGIDDDVSLREWRKHLAISGWTFDPDKAPPLQYRAVQCPSPVVHKSILSFVDAIRDEANRVEGEIAVQRGVLLSSPNTELLAERYRVVAPGQANADIQPKRIGGKPVYLYHDVQFKLDQDEVLQLLMGESLYGDPSLCLRELMQNALDALQLRDLRWQLVQDGQEPAEPVDPVIAADPLRVDVTWGETDDGDSFLRVSDNGVGMTGAVVRDYFTQIGKSFYRSASFERERALLKQGGKLATPISQFGIGILSCFMLADRLEVRTRPGAADRPGREPYDVTISGPGSLFWMREGTLDRQGTEITLYLKPDVRLYDDEPDALLERLRVAFKYPHDEKAARVAEQRQAEGTGRVVSPAFAVARYVVWPLYPVHLRPPGRDEIVVDGQFHLDKLAPLDVDAVRKKAEEWDVPAEALGKPEWVAWDWTDPETGSRLRVWVPRSHPDDLPFEDPPERSGHIPQDDFGSFVEATLESGLRTELLVKGMHVPDVKHARDAYGLMANVGTRVWIDLRGDASPTLLASRQAVRPHPEAETWSGVVDGVMERARAYFLHADDSKGKARNLRLGLAGRWTSSPSAPQAFMPWHSRDRVALLLQEAARTAARNVPSDRLYGSPHSRDLSAYGRDFSLAESIARFRNTSSDVDKAIRLLDADYIVKHLHDFLSSHALDLRLSMDMHASYIMTHNGLAVTDEGQRIVSFNASARETCEHLIHARTITSSITATLAQEQFYPSLEKSYPRLHLFHLAGKVSDGYLVAPAMPEFIRESDGRTVVRSPSGHEAGQKLNDYGYDLVFPLTAVPLGTLRQQCYAWSKGHRAFRLGVAPFLFFEAAEVWRQHADSLRKWFQVDGIYALLPPEELWYRPFAEWIDEDWQKGHSAFWDVTTGEVYWARGAQPREKMLEIGVSPHEMFPEMTAEPDI